MGQKFLFHFGILAFLFSVVAHAQNYEIEELPSDTYLGWNKKTGACSTPESIRIFQPRASGRFPVFIYSVGTGALISSAEAEVAAKEMTKRGFISVVLDYESGAGFSCDKMQLKAKCAYGENLATSATAKVCALASADCARGIVVAGLSQGANLAILANNHDSHVRAAWLISFGGAAVGNAYTQCYLDSQTKLPANRLRVINGREGQSQPLSNLNASTGTLCLGINQSCFRQNGSGWYLVENNQVEDHHADHCYFVGAADDGSEIGCSVNANRADVGWLPPANAPWSLNTNLDWLAKFVN